MVTVEDDTLSILVVEDDEDTAEVVCTLLSDAGYTTQTVDMGQAALEHIETSKPDLVLLDLNLPDINGLEILQTVRSSSFLPMIVLSGYGKDRDRVFALEAGADDYMGKPFSSGGAGGACKGAAAPRGMDSQAGYRPAGAQPGTGHATPARVN